MESIVEDDEGVSDFQLSVQYVKFKGDENELAKIEEDEKSEEKEKIVVENKTIIKKYLQLSVWDSQEILIVIIVAISLFLIVACTSTWLIYLKHKRSKLDQVEMLSGGLNKIHSTDNINITKMSVDMSKSP